MRLIASILISVALAAGVLSAATAYVVPTSLDEAMLVGLTLNAPAGVVRDDEGRVVVDESGGPVALVAAGDEEGRATVLTEEVLARLREAGVERVRVREFAFSRWSGRWLFLLSVVGLVVGAVMMRMSRARAIERSSAEGGDPAALLDEIIATVGDIRSDLDAMGGEDERLHAITQRVGALQEGAIAQFVDARERMVQRMGLARFATVMDRFASGERRLNRAWSAAADGVLAESVACLGDAEVRFGEARERMGG